MATQKLLPGVKWILPNAPNQPVTINGGMKMPSWYDIKSLADINQVRKEPTVHRLYIEANCVADRGRTWHAVISQDHS